MLILSRKLNEKIVISDGATEIHVSVVEIRGDQIKLGIDAPKSVKVYREEIYQAIQEENRRAATQAADIQTRLPSLGPASAR